MALDELTDGLSRQVAFECLVAVGKLVRTRRRRPLKGKLTSLHDRHSYHQRTLKIKMRIYRWKEMGKRQTYDLVREKLREVLHNLLAMKTNANAKTNLAVKIRLSRFGRVQLKTLPNAFAKHVACGVGLHNLRHSLLDERFETGEPVAKGRPQVISQVHADHDTGGRRINTHRVRHLEADNISRGIVLRTSNVHSPGILLVCTAQCRDCRSRPTAVEHQPRTCYSWCHPSGPYSIGMGVS
jgi:hypothetical protein